MKRRISAFISRKRKEVDEWNVQEFCGRSYVDEQDPAWGKFMVLFIYLLVDPPGIARAHDKIKQA